MNQMKEGRHQCLIYSGAPSEKLPLLAAVIHRMMQDGYRCLYMNSAAMVAGMRSCLASMGIDVALEIARARLILTSEPVTEDDNFDISLMLQKLEDSLDEALKAGYKGLWASGDITWELGSEKNFEKLMEYEWRLEALFHRRKELNGICQYHHDTLPQEVVRRGLITHPTLFVNETLSRINPHYISVSVGSGDAGDHALQDKTIAELCQPGSGPAGEKK